MSILNVGIAICYEGYVQELQEYTRARIINTWLGIQYVFGGIHGAVKFKLMVGIYSCVSCQHIFLQISIFQKIKVTFGP